MTDAKPNADDLTRIIVLVYGLLQDGNPFWVYVAVKPSKYQQFMTLHKEDKLDLYHFDPLGEIIISGEGKSPPDSITLKVAEMYQTDPATMFQPVDVDKEVERRVKEVEEKKNSE